MKGKVLLFGAGLQSICMARSLVEVGYEVDSIGGHNEIPRKSRYINHCFDIDEDNIMLSEILDVVRRGKYAVIIPMEDLHADWLSKHKEEIESSCDAKCAIENYDKYTLAGDKSCLMAFCKKNGLPVPRTLMLDNNLEEAASYVGFPSLIKPNVSAGARGIKIVNNIEELRSVFPPTEQEFGQCSLQEYISSKDYYFNVMLYRSFDGRFVNHCILKILRYYPIKGGSSSMCITIENEKIVSICKDVLQALDWHGFADFDVLEKGDGDYRIIEINPRVPASVRGAAVSGINYAEMIVADAMGENLKRYEYVPGKYLRFLGLDMVWFLSSPKRFTCKPSWFWFFGKNLFYMEGGKKDFRAMLESIWVGLKKEIDPEFRKKKSGMN